MSLAPPSVVLCARVWLVRMMLVFFVGWWLVALALVAGGIQRGPRVRGQWNGEAAGLGETGDNYPFESAVFAHWCAWFDVPDEPGPFPAYEPTVMRVYARFGWAATVWYNAAIRNPARGYVDRHRVQVNFEPSNATMRRTWCVIGYGWKGYRDWRAEALLPHGAVKPSYYVVPSFFNDEK